MKKLEADVTNKLKPWIVDVTKVSSPIEVKHTRGKNRFNMRELKEHQIDWLHAATTEQGCWWKIPDTGYGFNPFDVMFYKNSHAYVTIVFPQWACTISIQEIIKITAPSITEDEAVSISTFTMLSSNL